MNEGGREEKMRVGNEGRVRTVEAKETNPGTIKKEGKVERRWESNERKRVGNKGKAVKTNRREGGKVICVSNERSDSGMPIAPVPRRPPRVPHRQQREQQSPRQWWEGRQLSLRRRWMGSGSGTRSGRRSRFRRGFGCWSDRFERSCWSEEGWLKRGKRVEGGEVGVRRGETRRKRKEKPTTSILAVCDLQGGVIRLKADG